MTSINMRRTYKSKKDVGGGLDHRDMLINMDEKNSAFDAFYIQNIKQTKRELSCMGASNNYGVATNRVRKRKFVKRIIKNVEPPARESISDSVFLTPDKSIRVNKAPDLFDQLLNSSSPSLNPKQSKTVDRFEKLLAATPKPSKTYTRKKADIKKINYSNSDSSESDKENFNKNGTDIRSHQLIIENEAGPSSKVDESINNMVKKLSLIKQKSSSGSGKKAFKSNRLTRNYQSPLFQTSPLSSTPFIEKQRSKSIYKFSPIPMREFEESPNYVTIVEDEDVNKSVVFNIPKPNSISKKEKSKGSSSPLSHLLVTNSSKQKANSKSLFSTESIEADCDENLSKQPQALNLENNEVILTQTSSLQTSEFEPFLGFSNDVVAIVQNNIVANVNHEDSIILSTGKSAKHSQKSKKNFQFINVTDNSNYFSPSNDNASTVDVSMPSQPFLGFTKAVDEIADINTSINASVSKALHLELSKENDHDNKSKHDSLSSESCASVDSQKGRPSLYDTCNSEEMQELEEHIPKEPIVAVQRIDKSVFQKYYKRMINYSSGESDSSQKESESDENEKSELLDDVSHQKSNKTKKEPIVALEQMDKSLFQKYYNRMEKCASEDSTSLEISSNTEDSDGMSELLGDEEIDTEDNDTSKSDITSNDFLTDEDADSSSKDTDPSETEDMTVSESRKSEENRCISFVTTRRRNEYLNNSSIIILDDSVQSSSSSGCDKTVLSNNKESLDLNNTNVDNIPKDNCKVLDKDELRPLKLETNSPEPESWISNSSSKETIAAAVSDTIKTEYFIPEEINPGIVLQPGKKWERSLSIYRRMTTMNDHFNQSILDDENLQNKGRKYRQSVISTMELQDRRGEKKVTCSIAFVTSIQSFCVMSGSLHNESINSRRSTFVSKPSKSTIRIVKVQNTSRISLSSTTVFEDLKGFLEDCDDTIVELSKLSISEDHDITVLEKFHESSRIATARDYVLRRCNQSETLLFDECYPDTALKNCRKIGEGVFGEVFLWRAPDGYARVMKIVPIAGHTKVNGEHQKDFHEIIAEIVIAMELSALRAPISEIESHFDKGGDIEELDLHCIENATDVFNEVLAVRCVYGAYPSRLLDLWELYDECRGSENDNPAVLPPDQQFVVLELANAGQDLESFQFNSADQAHALFLQVAFALAVGEEAFQFEHRDLHWGNVLIQPTDQKYATFVLRGRVHRVLRRGVAGAVIDYSLSRVALPLGAAADAAALYNDLAADDGLFSAVGDYQFEVYRLMRDKLGNDWKNFEPYTNILWLHYVLDKMITALRYKRTNTKTHKQYIAKLKGIKERILNYGSAALFVLTDNEY